MRKLVPILSLTLVIFAIAKIVPSLKPQQACANSVSCAKNLNVQIENDATAIYNNQNIAPPKIYLSDKDLKPTVLADSVGVGEKHIYVDLTTQTLSAYQGDTLYLKTLVSTGKWRETPTGDFRIWVKLRATRMTGGEGADFYDLPNVPYVMFFGNSQVSPGLGFSLHGAYWHNNFGHPMSHGCVNMRPIDAEKLYNWVNPTTEGYTTYANQQDQGTLITIYGKTQI
ncbi:L,D-transpeptidase [Candidatus Woesebacteria bacterium]|nr:L,D-transpeptidase [Candidatus Woesebacteria bacterium]QQG47205.1 MAG: L,D-transpeptidase [Candidatus Woesebacteria bacterium]